jgi:hypothetical protein
VQHFIKQKDLQEVQSSPIEYWQKMERSTTSTRKKRNYKEKAKIYATSAVGSMAVESAEDSAVAAPGRGVEELGARVEEATKGVIRDIMPGAYSFALLKNPSISERGRAREELIFS